MAAKKKSAASKKSSAKSSAKKAAKKPAGKTSGKKKVAAKKKGNLMPEALSPRPRHPTRPFR